MCLINCSDFSACVCVSVCGIVCVCLCMYGEPVPSL